MGKFVLADGLTPKGDQPFLVEYKNSESIDRYVYVICNGEIYNYEVLAKKYNINLTSGSDCEIIPKLYIKIGIDNLSKELLGEFSYIIVDMGKMNYDNMKVFACNDTFGIRPLFMCIDENGINIGPISKYSSLNKPYKNAVRNAVKNIYQ